MEGMAQINQLPDMNDLSTIRSVLLVSIRDDLGAPFWDIGLPCTATKASSVARSLKLSNVDLG